MTQNPSFSDATLELLALRERSTTLDKLRAWLVAPWRLARYELACRKARRDERKSQVGPRGGLLSLSSQQFELIVGALFRHLGYRVLENNAGGADGGVDLILDREGQRFFVQCKQWKMRQVGVKPIRELFDLMRAGGVRDGFFVSAGSYTSEARAFADESGIALVDAVTLEPMIREIREGEPLRGKRA